MPTDLPGPRTLKPRRYKNRGVFITIKLSPEIRRQLDDEVEKLRQYGVDADDLDYAQVLLATFDYYRQRCEIMDASLGNTSAWQQWLQQVSSNVTKKGDGDAQ